MTRFTARLLRTLLIVCVSVGCLTAAAPEQTADETNALVVEKSYFTVAAFQCLAARHKDAATVADLDRLARDSVAAGRDVIDFFRTASPEQRKAVGPKIAVVWRVTMDGAPISTDFGLGMLYQTLTDDVYDEHITKRNSDPEWHKHGQEEWDRNKQTYWREHNCRSLRAPK